MEQRAFYLHAKHTEIKDLKEESKDRKCKTIDDYSKDGGEEILPRCFAFELRDVHSSI